MSLTEKIASLYLSTMMRIDSYNECEMQNTRERFINIFENLLEKENHREILIAVCKNTEMDFHLPIYDELIKQTFQMILRHGQITIEDIISKCPKRMCDFIDFTTKIGV